MTSTHRSRTDRKLSPTIFLFSGCTYTFQSKKSGIHRTHNRCCWGPFDCFFDFVTMQILSESQKSSVKWQISFSSLLLFHVPFSPFSEAEQMKLLYETLNQISLNDSARLYHRGLCDGSPLEPRRSNPLDRYHLAEFVANLEGEKTSSDRSSPLQDSMSNPRIETDFIRLSFHRKPTLSSSVVS